MGRSRTLAGVDKLFRSLGRRIRELRTAKGWSQEHFAEICGVHRTYMGHLERGEKNASLGSVARVAKAFGITLSELLSGIEAQPEVPLDPESQRSAKKAQNVGAGADIARVLEELQLERQTLRETVLTLKEVVLRQGRASGKHKRNVASRSRSGKGRTRSTSMDLKKSPPKSDKDV